MNEVYIVSAKRTAIGSFQGSLKNTSASELAEVLLKNMINETKIDSKDIDEIVLGNVLPAGQGQGVARQASINAGIDVGVPAYSLNMVCGSGMKTVMNAYMGICSGLQSLVLAGGTESMSQAPYLIPGSMRNGRKLGDFQVIDHMINDALTDSFENYHMGITAENISRKYNITRSEQDQFAISSQEKAIKAIDSGRFSEEIVPVVSKSRKGDFTIDKDEYPNRTTNIEKLYGLRPAFENDGTVTAGNSSGLNDGASCVMVASREMIAKYQLKPLVKIIGIGQGGVDPRVMGLGPTQAIHNALNHAKLELEDIDLIELNEAFAAQSLGVIHEICEEHGVDPQNLMNKTNVNGGAIALGHPLGASGNRIIVSLIHEMLKRDVRYGLASLCIGGGMGTAIILEKVD